MGGCERRSIRRMRTKQVRCCSVWLPQTHLASVEELSGFLCSRASGAILAAPTSLRTSGTWRRYSRMPSPRFKLRTFSRSPPEPRRKPVCRPNRASSEAVL
jgi:hypothetical protein